MQHSKSENKLVSLEGHKGNIAVRHIDSTQSRAVDVMFLPGWMSTMNGDKSVAVQKFCETMDIGFTVFDYSGHGESDSDLYHCDVDDWFQDALCVFDWLLSKKKETKKRVILVGSSMGGWMALNLALRRQCDVAGILLIAPAIDMTAIRYESLSTELIKTLDECGYIKVDSEYSSEPIKISRDFFKSGESMMLMGKPINFSCPVRIFHGMADDVIEYQRSIRFIEQMKDDDLELTLIKKGDHRLSSPSDLALLIESLQSLLAKQ